MKDRDEAPTSNRTPGAPEPHGGPSPQTPPAAPVSLRGQTKRVVSKIEQRARIACVASLAALGLIVWSLVHPKPLPVIVAMSVGQAIGTLSLLFFLGSVVLDLRSRRLLGPGANLPAPGYDGASDPLRGPPPQIPPRPSNPSQDKAE